MQHVKKRFTFLAGCMILLLAMPLLTWAQTRNITGRVLSQSDRRPVGGAAVFIKGGSTNTVSDDFGTFSIAANASDSLTINAVGFLPRTVSASLDSVEILLTSANTTLQEVIVVGYGTQKRGDVTGSITSVQAKDIKSLPVPDAGQAMQGRASGVQIISSGAPGSNVTIRIRGVGTINSADPLLVIDGVPTDVPLNTLNPDDIASMDILKDASASAIYGSRGANGVVIITTKRGSASKSNLNFSYYYGSQKATNMIKLLDASQFASLHNEMMKNNGQAQDPDFADPTSLGKGTDWLGAMFRTAPIQNISVSYSGGSPKSTYYVSGSVMDQQGIVINTSYKRYTVQFNSDSKVFDWLRFGNNITLNHDNKSNGDYSIQNAMAALPTQPMYNADGSYAQTTMGDITNPIGKALVNSNRTLGYNLLGNIFAEVTLMKGLKFKTTGGLQGIFYDTRTWDPKYDWQPNPQEYSYLAESYNKSWTLMWDNTLTYDTYIGDHHITGMVGSSAQNNRFDYMNGSVQGFASDATQQLDNGNQPSLATIGGSANEWALLSYMARANYDYAGKYLLTATVRRDGSSRFGPENRYGTFPSASFAWRISKEGFWKDNNIVNDLKLRVGYGVTGNQNIGNYSFASVYETYLYNFNGTDVPTVIPTMLPNPNVKWERVVQSNLGIDAALLNNRINVTVDGYIKSTNDMLVPMVVPVTTGYSDLVVPNINLGKVRNSGVELTITSANFRGGDFEWNTTFNISYNKNKILALNDTIPMYTGSIGLSQNLAIQHVGYPINEFYGYVTDGIFQTQQEVDNSALQVPGSDPYNRTSPGDIKFKDLNNDGVINDADRTYLGNPNPSFIFSLNNSFSYKGFDMAIFLQGISGNKIFNANRIYLESMAVLQNQDTYTLDRWNGEGTSNSMPRAVYNDPNQNMRVSDRYIEDGSYLRIKNLTLGYTLPKALSLKAKLTTARFYISCQNLVTFSKYKGFDPEVSSNGIDLNAYPVTRTLSAGVNVTF